jgi:hypothetical protein
MRRMMSPTLRSDVAFLSSLTRTTVPSAIRAALVKGDRGMCKIAVALGVGVGTVQRVAAELKMAA